MRFTTLVGKILSKILPLPKIKMAMSGRLPLTIRFCMNDCVISARGIISRRPLSVPNWISAVQRIPTTSAANVRLLWMSSWIWHRSTRCLSPISSIRKIWISSPLRKNLPFCHSRLRNSSWWISTVHCPPNAGNSWLNLLFFFKISPDFAFFYLL